MAKHLTIRSVSSDPSSEHANFSRFCVIPYSSQPPRLRILDLNAWGFCFRLQVVQGTESERHVSNLLSSMLDSPSDVFRPLAPSWIECLICHFLPTWYLGSLRFRISKSGCMRIRSDHRCRHRLGSSLRWVGEGHASLAAIAARIQPVR